jgi:hypothetical protein
MLGVAENDVRAFGGSKAVSFDVVAGVGGRS